jgi:hypothetical protein
VTTALTIAERRRNRQFGLTAELATGGFVVPAHISIDGNRFTLVSSQGDETPWQQLYLDIVIAGSNPISLRTFYDPTKVYNANAPKEEKTPWCSSEDGVGPREGSQHPQAPTCAQCPRNAWGSDPRGGKGKACGERKRLSVVVVNDPNPLAAYMFGVSGGSHKNLRDYAKFVNDLPPQQGVKVELESVVTRVEFESQGVLKFTCTGWADQATLAKVDQLAETGLLDQVVGLGQAQPALPAPVAASQITQGFQQTAPQPAFQQAAPAFQQAAPAFQPAVQQSPFGGAGPAAVSTFAPQPSSASFGAPAAANSGFTSSEPPKRHRRTKAEMEAARAAEGAKAPLAFESNKTPAPQFGLVPSENAPRPDAALSAAIDSMLGLSIPVPSEE